MKIVVPQNIMNFFNTIINQITGPIAGNSIAVVVIIIVGILVIEPVGR